MTQLGTGYPGNELPTDNTEGGETPADVLAAAEAALDNMLCHSRESSGSTEAYRRDSVNEIARAILVERVKAEMIADILMKAVRTIELMAPNVPALKPHLAELKGMSADAKKAVAEVTA